MARYAIDHGYQVELREPESDWWQQIRTLLKDKQAAREMFNQWADRLAEMSRAGHRVPVSIIRHWMNAWTPDLTVDEILRSSLEGER